MAKLSDEQIDQLMEILNDEDVKLKIFAREKAEFAKQTANSYARKEGKKEVAKKLIEKGFPIEEVVEISGLTKEEILEK